MYPRFMEAIVIEFLKDWGLVAELPAKYYHFTSYKLHLMTPLVIFMDYPRAQRHQLQHFLQKTNRSEDLAVVNLEGSGQSNLIIASSYMSHDMPSPPVEVQLLVRQLQKGKDTLLLGCDANARHSLYGAVRKSTKGKILAPMHLKPLQLGKSTIGYVYRENSSQLAYPIRRR